SLFTCANGTTVSEDCKTGVKPVRWDYYNNPNRQKVFDTFRKLNYLKTNYTAFRDLNHYMEVETYKKVLRFGNDDLNAVIVGNFNVVNEDMYPGFPFSGKWYDYLSGDSINVSDQNAPINYAPGE